MKIDIVSSVFSPEPIISARTSADLAQQLARNGHRVRVFTAFPGFVTNPSPISRFIASSPFSPPIRAYRADF
jgi:hypothetical protein